MYCPDEILRKHVSRSLGARVDNIPEADLLNKTDEKAAKDAHAWI